MCPAPLQDDSRAACETQVAPANFPKSLEQQPLPAEDYDAVPETTNHANYSGGRQPL